MNMKVYRPTDNPISTNGGYTATHKGYDFSGNNLPDEVRSGKDGEIIERVDEHTTNWRNTGTLTTRDYGNYIKVRHTDGTYALFAHLRKGSSFVKGTKVTAGQTIARIGNTGNSTGPHLHAEYRNSSNINVPVEFYTNTTPFPDQGTVSNMYEGYDLSNPESMKVAVDVLVRLMQGDLIDREKYEKDIQERDRKVKDASEKVVILENELRDFKKKYLDSKESIIELQKEIEKADDEVTDAIRYQMIAEDNLKELQITIDLVLQALELPFDAERVVISDAIADLRKPHDKVADEAVQAYLYKRAEKLFTSFIDWLKYGLKVWRNRKS